MKEYIGAMSDEEMATDGWVRFARHPEQIIPGAKNSQRKPGAFLSEIVQY